MPLPRTSLAFLALSSSFGLVLTGPARAQLGTPLVPPKLQNLNGASDASLDNGLTLASRVSTGTLMAGFSSNDPALGGGGDTDIYFTISRDKGATWTPPFAIPTLIAPDGAAIDVEPSVASKSGGYMMVWASTFMSPNGTYDIFSANGNSDGSSWVNPFAVGFTTGVDTVNDRLPYVAASGNTSVVAWQRNHVGAETDIWFSRTTGNGGPAWSPAAPLQSNAATDDGRDAQVQLATNGLSVWVAVWLSTSTLGGTIGGEGDILFARSTDDGVTWSAPAALNTTAFADSLTQDSRPSIAVDNASGTWITTWTAENAFGGALGSDTDILFARSTDGGTTWSAPAALNTNAATDSSGIDADENPSITADQLGRFVCVWERATGGGDRDIVGALSDDLGLTWSTPTTVNTNAATDAGQDTFPRIVSDGTGHFITAWNSTDSLGGTIGTDGDLLTTRFMTPSSSGLLATRFCFGFTEAGNVNPCPCGNSSSASSNGCRNSTGQGAVVTVIDTTSVSAATVRIQGNALTPGGAVLMFQGTGQFNFGLGLTFGDGLLCIGGTISRLAVGFANGSGQAVVNTVPTNVSPGSVRYYQGWYRDVGAVCGGGLFNLTSAVATTWIP